MLRRNLEKPKNKKATSLSAVSLPCDIRNGQCQAIDLFSVSKISVSFSFV